MRIVFRFERVTFNFAVSLLVSTVILVAGKPLGNQLSD